MQSTGIEWTDLSANLLKYRDADGKTVWHCEKISPGCAHCYSEAIRQRRPVPADGHAETAGLSIGPSWPSWTYRSRGTVGTEQRREVVSRRFPSQEGAGDAMTQVDEVDDDLDINAIVRGLAMLLRRESVELCMAGNDTQCFTQERYWEAYKTRTKWDPVTSSLFDDRLFRQHMASVKCVEVKPGVWTTRRNAITFLTGGDSRRRSDGDPVTEIV